MKYMRLNTKVVDARWNEEDQQWHVKIQRTDDPDTLIEDKAHILINANGVLKYVPDMHRLLSCVTKRLNSKWKWPAIPGRETFEGTMLHSANWDDSIQLESKRVAVIGSGSSGVQIVPNIQPRWSFPSD
jgi:cation diffusion facilitator CzcD-associated flavoprotein CzcO